MPTDKNLYCKIFLNSSLSLGEVLTLVRRITASKGGYLGSLQSDILQIYVDENDDYDASRLWSEVCWPYFLDVDPTPGASPAEYKAAIGDFLRRLWALDVDAVPACDFEDELPSRN